MTREHAQTYAKAPDRYAAARCECRHLVYADDTPGDSCRFGLEGLCDCADHRPAVSVEEGGAS